MARMRNKLLMLVAVVGLAVPTWAGSTVVAQEAPEHPNRVLIVLFDQMLPEYADQFDMPNYRSLRDAGTNFKRAYLGYMASETVMAHNVITSGLLPKNMGWTDEAYRDTENLFGRGTDAMHITGDLSLADFGTLIEPRGVPEARRLPTRRVPGDEVHRGRGEVLCRRIRGRPDRRHRRPDVRPLVQHAGRVRAGARGQVPPAVGQGGPHVSLPAVLRAVLHQLVGRAPLRHPRRVPIVDLPRGRQPFLPWHGPLRTGGTHRRGRVGRGCRDRDDAARAVVGHVRHARRDRQGGPHVGGPGRCRHLHGRLRRG